MRPLAARQARLPVLVAVLEQLRQLSGVENMGALALLCAIADAEWGGCVVELIGLIGSLMEDDARNFRDAVGLVAVEHRELFQRAADDAEKVRRACVTLLGRELGRARADGVRP
ncbi:MAG TPA: hypothetical protein VHB21_08865 [Minicystis sp.]|nr:hypothetical protein [Minicystis sp.]